MLSHDEVKEILKPLAMNAIDLDVIKNTYSQILEEETDRVIDECEDIVKLRHVGRIYLTLREAGLTNHEMLRAVILFLGSTVAPAEHPLGTVSNDPLSPREMTDWLIDKEKL